jgi:hypothetical protein
MRMRKASVELFEEIRRVIARSAAEIARSHPELVDARGRIRRRALEAALRERLGGRVHRPATGCAYPAGTRGLGPSSVASAMACSNGIARPSAQSTAKASSPSAACAAARRAIGTR